jgi:peptidoglycan/xylan/chitin deacetylase (PgdA/CDA1 family)
MIDAVDRMRSIVMTSARMSGLSMLASAAMGSAGAVFMLHRVNDTTDPTSPNAHLTVTPKFLDATLSDAKRLGYRFVAMDEAVEELVSRSRSSARFAAITFDDGYLDNLTNALPVLEAHDAPATIYIAPGLTDGTVRPWWEIVDFAIKRRNTLYVPTGQGTLPLDCSSPKARQEAWRRLSAHFTTTLPERDIQAALDALVGRGEAMGGPFMDWDQLRAIARHDLVDLGAHTINHVNLKRLEESDALEEMVASARIIESETGSRPRHFAYPYGYEAAVGAREVGLARAAGFASAVTTRHGILTSEHADHLHALPRISLNGRHQNVGHVRTMLSGFTTALANRGRRTVSV